MRDQFAPIIEGFDLDGLVNPYSFRCEKFYTERYENVTLLDGTTIHDMFPAKLRLSWTLNVAFRDHYTAFFAALRSGEPTNTVSAQVFDPTENASRLATFHITPPTVHIIRNLGYLIAIPRSPLILEEATPNG